MAKRTERGWAAHFCSSSDCLFRRNTLLEHEGKHIVVSTVGAAIDPLRKGSRTHKFMFVEIALGKHFDTAAFIGKDDGRYIDADTSQQIYFDAPCFIEELDADDRANDMHEAVVKELMEKMEIPDNIFWLKIGVL